MVELFYLEVMNPLDSEKGYNRFKLWIGAMLYSFQFIFKLDAVNNVFEGSTRKCLLIVAMLNVTYNIMRMQKTMVYRPIGKDLENLPQVMALGGLLISNFMMMLGAKKENMEANFNHKINCIRKDFEL